ncbi:hypothetical protein L916_21466, partial [Phytophthora nicotianae]
TGLTSFILVGGLLSTVGAFQLSPRILGSYTDIDPGYVRSYRERSCLRAVVQKLS